MLLTYNITIPCEYYLQYKEKVFTWLKTVLSIHCSNQNVLVNNRTIKERSSGKAKDRERWWHAMHYSQCNATEARKLFISVWKSFEKILIPIKWEICFLLMLLLFYKKKTDKLQFFVKIKIWKSKKLKTCTVWRSWIFFL